MGSLFASPRWVVESWKAAELQPADEYRPLKPSKVVANKAEKDPASKTARTRASSVFRGCLFSLVRLSPPAGAADFDAAQLTTEIVSNGGQMLSAKVVEALRSDQRRTDASRRTCYIVFWGGFTKTHISIHMLLSQLQKEDLCNVVPVSVVWLKTAVADGKLPPSVGHKPLLFEPQPWPLRLLSKGLKLAVTGFVRSERTAIIQLIRAVGASYTENMKPTNSHLICREPKGRKYDKAIEWKLHVVSIDWLYHVVRYGYGGEKGTEKTGCESVFSVIQSDPEKLTEQEDDDNQPMSHEVAETQFMV